MSRTLLFMAGLAIVGCSSSPEVTRDYDPTTNFKAMKTWAWVPEAPQADGGGVSSLSHERLRSAIEQEFTHRGYMRVEPKSADFWVQYHALLAQWIELDPYSYDSGEVHRYKEGTIVVDVITPKDRRLVWRGTAQGAVEKDLTPDERQKRIREVVSEILEEFPPKK